MVRQKVEPLMAQSGLHELISSVSKWLCSLACRLYQPLKILCCFGLIFSWQFASSLDSYDNNFYFFMQEEDNLVLPHPIQGGPCGR